MTATDIFITCYVVGVAVVLLAGAGWAAWMDSGDIGAEYQRSSGIE